jgi:N-acetylglutamate synthase-like GNAT family acetyltransferase
VILGNSLSTKHEFICYSEDVIRSCEQNYNITKSSNEWTMWLDRESFKPLLDNSIELLSVKEEKDWNDMLDLRIKIEIAFGLTNIETIKKLVNDIKVKSTKLNGQWFLLKKQNKVIGEFGLVPFTFENKTVGRIQDVDIAPEYQGNGFGNILLSYICNAAIENKYEALCLMAKADDWPKDWYFKFGFKKVGEI